MYSQATCMFRTDYWLGESRDSEMRGQGLTWCRAALKAVLSMTRVAAGAHVLEPSAAARECSRSSTWRSSPYARTSRPATSAAFATSPAPALPNRAPLFAWHVASCTLVLVEHVKGIQGY